MSHIALLLPDLEVGGAQRVMIFLAKEFSARGHNVDLVLLNSSGPLINDIPKGVNVIDLASRSFGLGQMGFVISSVIRLSSWMKRQAPNVLLSTITGANLVALLARKVSSVSVRVVIREAVTLDNVCSVLRLRAMIWLYPQADAIVALSPFMREELIARVGVSPDQIICITNPVDVGYIRKQALAPVNHPWLKDDGLKVVVAVGRLVPQKDYGTLLHAFALLPEAVPVRLIVVGEGSEHSMLENLAADLGIADRVNLVGFDANPWRWMSRSDLFVLSSLWEGHPNVLLEALALRLRVVASEYDESIHGLFEKMQGYPHRLVEVGKPKIMAAAIQGLIINDSGKGGVANFQFDVKRIINIYEGVLFPSF